MIRPGLLDAVFNRSRRRKKRAARRPGMVMLAWPYVTNRHLISFGSTRRRRVQLDSHPGGWSGGSGAGTTFLPGPTWPVCPASPLAAGGIMQEVSIFFAKLGIGSLIRPFGVS